MKIYHITWRDSNLYNEQGDSDYPFEVTVIESVGFVLQESKDSITITRDLMKKESRGAVTIPRENILKIKKLEQPTP